MSRRNEVIRLYREGKTLKAIAEETKMSTSGVQGHLRRSGILKEIGRHKVYKVDNTYFDVINTQNKAYYLGMMFADGHLRDSPTSKTISLALKTEDGYIVERMAKEMKAEIPLRIEKPGRLIKGTTCKGSGSMKLTIGSKELFNHLNSKGCTPKKSLTLTFPTCISEELISHFIRGYYDGDGGITKSANGSYKVMMLGTKMFLEKVGEILKEKLDIDIHLSKRGNIHNFYLYKKRDVIKFCQWIYRDADIYITRKYNRYIDYKNVGSTLKKVVQYTMTGKVVRVWECAADAARELKTLSSNITQCCRGISKTCSQYIWRYYTEDGPIQVEEGYISSRVINKYKNK